MLFYEPDTLYANTNFSFPYLTRGVTGGGGIFIKRVRFIILEKRTLIIVLDRIAHLLLISCMFMRFFVVKKIK